MTLRRKKPARPRRRRFPDHPECTLLWLDCRIRVISLTDTPPTEEEAELAAKLACRELGVPYLDGMKR